MKRLLKLYVSLSPIISLFLIVVINIYSLFNYDSYSKNAYWINMFVGISAVQILRDLALVKLFSFCEVSKYSCYAILSFIPIYLIIYSVYGVETKENIIYQIIVGITALFITLVAYIKKYPQCRLSIYLKAKKYSIELWNSFLMSLAKNNFSCYDALNDYKEKRKIYHKNDKQYTRI